MSPYARNQTVGGLSPNLIPNLRVTLTSVSIKGDPGLVDCSQTHTSQWRLGRDVHINMRGE